MRYEVEIWGWKERKKIESTAKRYLRCEGVLGIDRRMPVSFERRTAKGKDEEEGQRENMEI